jgi:hypothetical protein
LINILCDNALLNGYALDKAVVDAKSVREVAKDLKLKGEPRKIWGRLLLALFIAGIALLLVYMHRTGTLALFYNGILQGFHYLRGLIATELQPLFNWIFSLTAAARQHSSTAALIYSLCEVLRSVWF